MYLVKIEKIVKNGQNSFFKGFFGLKNFFNIYEIFLLILLFYVYELRFKDYINRCLNYKIVDFRRWISEKWKGNHEGSIKYHKNAPAWYAGARVIID
ncbi:hypothetical protein EF405_15865 [Cyclobacteriaceae bacterium YHN15]|jgi:hypothetical protein|nr:hypothetical protein EF405_15865 [Cyclobacteriaceae bacterium YHN15]